MDVPGYVPAAVKMEISSILYGDGQEYGGWEQLLFKQEKELRGIEEKLRLSPKKTLSKYAEELYCKRKENLSLKKTLEHDVLALKRLAYDPRMQEVYAKLTAELKEDNQFRNYISSAWAAKQDYSIYRAQLKQVIHLNSKIGKASDKLAGLIKEINEIGYSFWPSEFFSIPELLRTTDNHKMNDHNLHMWQSMRKYILGDRRESQEGEVIQPKIQPTDYQDIKIELVSPGDDIEIDPEEERRNTLHYAWGAAPPLSSLLDTITKASKGFQPTYDDVIGVAIRSRKANEKTEYIRAFGSILIDRYKFKLTNNLMASIAITANVILNNENIDVSIDDVRKALANTG